MKEQAWREYLRHRQITEDAMWAVNPDASDAEIAKAIANYLLVKQPPYRLGITHDVRARKQRVIHSADFGPCPLDYTWQHKNTVGITTLDEYIAEQWIIKALDAGICPHGVAPQGIRSGGHGPGTLASFRRHLRERLERKRAQQIRAVAGGSK